MLCDYCMKTILFCKICLNCKKKFCSDSCLTRHEFEHYKNSNLKEKLLYEKPIIQKNSSQNSVTDSPYITDGYMVTKIKYDETYDLKNYNPVMVFNEPKIIGTGSYGKVILVKNIIDNKLYAIKHMAKKNLYKTLHSLSGIKQEINIQSRIYHPNIVRLLYVKEDEKNYDLVMEYANGGSLFYYIRKNKFLTEKESFKYFIQMANAIYFLHLNDLIHRDIKPENILIFNNNNVKLCDFGWCVRLEGKQRKTFCGTTEYMAPEIVNNVEYSKSIDVWSLGILLYEMIHGFSPFKPNKENFQSREIMENILIHDLKFKKGVSEECKDLICHLLDSNVEKRYKVEDIFNSKFVKKYEQEKYYIPDDDIFQNKYDNKNVTVKLNNNMENYCLEKNELNDIKLNSTFNTVNKKCNKSQSPKKNEKNELINIEKKNKYIYSTFNKNNNKKYSLFISNILPKEIKSKFIIPYKTDNNFQLNKKNIKILEPNGGYFAFLPQTQSNQKIKKRSNKFHLYSFSKSKKIVNNRWQKNLELSTNYFSTSNILNATGINTYNHSLENISTSRNNKLNKEKNSKNQNLNTYDSSKTCSNYLSGNNFNLKKQNITAKKLFSNRVSKPSPSIKKILVQVKKNNFHNKSAENRNNKIKNELLTKNKNFSKSNGNIQLNNNNSEKLIKSNNLLNKNILNKSNKKNEKNNCDNECDDSTLILKNKKKNIINFLSQNIMSNNNPKKVINQNYNNETEFLKRKQILLLNKSFPIYTNNMIKKLNGIEDNPTLLGDGISNRKNNAQYIEPIQKDINLKTQKNFLKKRYNLNSSITSRSFMKSYNNKFNEKNEKQKSKLDEIKVNLNNKKKINTERKIDIINYNKEINIIYRKNINNINKKNLYNTKCIKIPNKNKILKKPNLSGNLPEKINQVIYTDLSDITDRNLKCYLNNKTSNNKNVDYFKNISSNNGNNKLNNLDSFAQKNKEIEIKKREQNKLDLTPKKQEDKVRIIPNKLLKELHLK